MTCIKRFLRVVKKPLERNKKQLRYSNGKWFVKVKSERYILEQGRKTILHRENLRKPPKKPKHKNS